MRKNYSSALFSANCSLDILESIEMLSLKVHCLRKLNRFSESLQLLDQISDKLTNSSELKNREKITDFLEDMRRLTIDQMKRTPEAEDCSPINEPNEINQKWIHPALEIRHSPKEGRFIVANQFIPERTVILVESPVISRLNEQRMDFCNICFKAVDSQFWPCDGCDEVVFCSKQCWLKAPQSGHTYECGFIRFFDIMPGSQMSYKLVSTIGVRRAMDLMRDNDNSIIKDHGRWAEATDPETRFRFFSSLCDNEGISMGPHKELAIVLKAIETAFAFDFTGQLDFVPEEDFESFVDLVEFCYKMNRKTLFNCFAVRSYRKDPIGSMACPMAALFNHSCLPNIYWSSMNGTFVGITLIDIEEGQEITDCYGPSALLEGVVDRQSKLRTNYLFDCHCHSCLIDFRSVLSLRCLQCSGPVFYRYDDSADLSSLRLCVQCGTPFDDWQIKSKEVEELHQIFCREIKELSGDPIRYQSLASAEFALKKLMQMVCPSSVPLLTCLTRLVEVYHKYGMVERALDCGAAVEAAIDEQLKPVFGQKRVSFTIIKVLLLMTDLYHQYVSESQTLNKIDRNRCLRMYSKLLKMLDNCQALDQKSFKELNRLSIDHSERKRREFHWLTQLLS